MSGRFPAFPLGFSLSNYQVIEIQHVVPTNFSFYGGVSLSLGSFGEWLRTAGLGWKWHKAGGKYLITWAGCEAD